MRTTPFTDTAGNILPGSIAEIARPMIGGVPQWVMIRGASTANPVLVLLHGGPGMPETSLFRIRNAPLERCFTVVYWEQRGAGKSFSAAIPASSMTTERFVLDLDEVVELVRARLGKDKVVLLGHSWGSALGTLYAARFPQKVAAYVGTGQIGNLAASEAASYRFVLDEAKRRGNRKGVEELTRLGPPPYDQKQMMVQRRWLGRFVGVLGTVPVSSGLRAMLFGPESSVLDLAGILRGTFFTLRTMWSEVASLDLETAVPELKMPVWFLSGRNDHQVDAQVAERYFEMLVAPKKRLVWFEKSGHFVPFEEPEKFNETMAAIAAEIAG